MKTQIYKLSKIGLVGMMCMLAFLNVQSQTVTQTTDADILAQTLAGPGVVISNATLDCGSTSSGVFDATGNAGMPVSSGIILSSGIIDSVLIPNCGTSSGCSWNYFNSAWTSSPSDPDLDDLITSSLSGYDGCVLEFDVFVTADTMRFNYVWASEEYNEYVGSVFNDVFGFFLSGPGISGSYSNNAINLALIPNTSTAVAINNVNCGSNGTYFICNDAQSSYAGGCNTSICPNPTNINTTVSYDGMTVKMKAEAIVEPCNTYHLKLGVQDVGDGVFDSGVFIETGSLTAVGVQIIPIASYLNPINDLPTAVEGCVNAELTALLSYSPTDSVLIPVIVTGTAQYGVDFTYGSAFNDTVVFTPGDSISTIYINPTLDSVSDPFEYIMVIYQPQMCSTADWDTAIVYISEFIEADATEDSTICPGTPFDMTVNGGTAIAYDWYPNVAMTCNTCQNTTVSPTNTTIYYITLTPISGGNPNCTATDSVIVSMAVYADAGIDLGICPGFSTTIIATGGATYSWTPATGLSSTTDSVVVANPDTTTTYYLTTFSPQFGCSDWDTMVVEVFPETVGWISADTIICFDQDAFLSAGGGELYSWDPQSTLSDPFISNPVAHPYSITTYQVIITDLNSCRDTLSTIVDVYPEPWINVSGPQFLYYGESVELFIEGGASYQWTPDIALQYGNTANPVVSPTMSTTYTVLITTENGCFYNREVPVTVWGETLVLAPNIFSPNGDGYNDQFSLIVRGIFTLKKLSIADRWGEIIFQTNNIDQGWNGTYKGQNVPIGTYVYVVEGLDYTGSSMVKSGNFILLR